MAEHLTRLHRFIVKHHNLEELRTLCFELDVRYDDLGGEGISARARELALRLGRQKRAEFLFFLCVLASWRPCVKNTPLPLRASALKPLHLCAKKGIMPPVYNPEKEA